MQPTQDLRDLVCHVKAPPDKVYSSAARSFPKCQEQLAEHQESSGWEHLSFPADLCINNLAPSTLDNKARAWFDKLPPGSIDNWGSLQEKFLNRFGMLKAYDKDPTEISKIVRKGNETPPFQRKRAFRSTELPWGEFQRRDTPVQWQLEMALESGKLNYSVKDVRQRGGGGNGTMAHKRESPIMRSLGRGIGGRSQGGRISVSGFFGEHIKPLGKIELGVRFRGSGRCQRAIMKFRIIPAPSPYNIILGRSGLKKLRAVEPPEEKETQDTVGPTEQVLVNPAYPEQLVVIGKGLSPEGSTQLKNLVKKNTDIFVWEPADMTGVTKNIIKHFLNANPLVAPAKTKDIAEMQSPKAWGNAKSGGKVSGAKPTKLCSAGKAGSSLTACIQKIEKILQSSSYHRHYGPTNQANFKQGRHVGKKDYKEECVLYTNGASSAKGSGVRLVLISPIKTEYTYALRLNFKSTNNQAEYEALLSGLRIAKKIRVQSLSVNVDSKLVANQINVNYEACKENMIRYLSKEKEYIGCFKIFKIQNIPRNKNQRADVLSRLASVAFNHLTKEILVETLDVPSMDMEEINAVVEEEKETWMTPVINCLERGVWPEDQNEARALRIKIGQYVMEEGVLFKRSYLMPMLCLEENKIRNDSRGLFYKVDRGQTTSQNDRERSVCMGQHCLSANGVVERENRSLMEGIKTRLGNGRKGWVDELPNVLWAHRTSLKTKNGETPYNLTFKSEAVIPAEISMPTHRTMMIKEGEGNKEEMRLNHDLLTERREETAIQEARYKMKMEQYYNKRVCSMSFKVGEYVY
nr:reverse transcriptase domain-containing protein [Tanacetum cinerariifolium]